MDARAVLLSRRFSDDDVVISVEGVAGIAGDELVRDNAGDEAVVDTLLGNIAMCSSTFASKGRVCMVLVTPRFKDSKGRIFGSLSMPSFRDSVALQAPSGSSGAVTACSERS